MTNCVEIYGSFWVHEDMYGTFEVYCGENFRGNLMGNPFKGRLSYLGNCLSEGVFHVETPLDLEMNIHGNFLVIIDNPDFYQPYEGTFYWNPRTRESNFTVSRPFPQSMHESWRRTLRKELVKDYFIKLKNQLDIARKRSTVFPSEEDVFTWTKDFPIDKIKVVILGQDPYHEAVLGQDPYHEAVLGQDQYHEAGQAHGLAFSVKRDVPIPPSLENIFEELRRENLYGDPPHGNLRGWSVQGVLLLNTCLTVEKGKAGSHKGQGWEKFTDAIISHLSENSYGIVFILWGKEAQKKIKIIDEGKHFILKGAHPSGLSANRRKDGFFSRTANGARNTNIPQYFLKCNQILKTLDKEEIYWENL